MIQVRTVSAWRAYSLSLLLSALTAASVVLLSGWIGPSAALLFALPVVASAWYGGFGPGALATLLSTLTLSYLFLPPLNSTDFINSGAVAQLGLAALVMALLTALAARHRQNEQQAREQLDRAQVLARVTQVLTGPGLTSQSVLDAAGRELAATTADAFSLLLLGEGGEWLTAATTHHPDADGANVLREVYAAPQRASEGIYGQAIRSGEAVALPKASFEQLRAGIKPRYWPSLERLAGQHLLVVPLRCSGRVLGLLNLLRAPKRGPHPKSEHAFWQAFTDRVAAALEVTRRWEAEQRARQSAEASAEDAVLLQTIGVALSGARSAEQVARALADAALRPLGGAYGVLAVLGHASASLEVIAIPGEAPPAHMPRHLALDTLDPLTDVVRTGRPLWLNSPEMAPAHYPAARERAFPQRGALAVVPLLLDATRYGSLAIETLEPGEIGATMRELLVAVARLCAQALERIRRQQAEIAARQSAEAVQAEAEVGRLRALYLAEVSNVLASSLSLPTTLAHIARLALAYLGDFAIVYALGTDGVPHGAAHAHRDPQKDALLATACQLLQAMPGRSRSLLSELLRSGRPLHVPEISESMLEALPAESGLRQAVRQLGPRSLLVLPLALEQRTVGVLLLCWTTAGRQYERAEQVLAQEVAVRAARAIEHALRHAVAQSLNAQLEEVVNERTEELQATIEKLEAEIVQREQTQAQLELSREQLRNLSARLEQAREEERTRIAREVHEVLGQQLSSLKLDIAWLRKKMREQQEPLLNKAKSMAEVIDTTVHTVRKITQELRPGILDDFGLLAAIEWQLQEFQNRHGIETHLASEVKEIDLPPGDATAVFRVFQETLTNVVRHAEATRVDVSLERHDNYLVIQVEDDGRGITEPELNGAGSLGLLGMRERIHLLSGEIEIRGTPGEGTIVRMKLPLPEVEAPKQGNGSARAAEPVDKAPSGNAPI